MKEKTGAKVANAITRVLKILAIMLGAVLLIAGCAFVAYDYAFDFFTNDPYEVYDKDAEQIVLDIPRGATTTEIGQILEEHGLVKSAVAFRWKAQLSGDADSFQYGTYTFIKGMTYPALVEVLKTGSKAKSVRITIVEGWTIDQIAKYLQSKNICLAEDFIAACDKETFDFDYYDELLANKEDRRHLLEGYICPNTYEVIPANGVDAIVKRLLRQTELILEKYSTQIKKSGLTVDEVMTMASVIEKEAMLNADRPKVARVLLNRNAQGMRWQLDSTVLYSLGLESAGENDAIIADHRDDETNPYSKYNSYLYKKIAGPVCNPSEASINAVLNPAKGNWLFFRNSSKNDGSLVFSADLG